jgi:hypothetical protein
VSRLPLAVDLVTRMGEDVLHVVGGEKVILNKEERLQSFLGGLDEADELELADAQGQLEEASVRFKAARQRVNEVSGRCAQKREIRARMRELIAEGQAFNDQAAKTISVDLKELGFAHTRPELVGCSPAEKATV